MSGHSKWATTKHKKAVVDARRGKMFAKLIKNIEVAAKMGGGDLAGNPTLYDAIQKAKKSSVPNDNIDRAVKRGSGAEAGGADYTTIMDLLPADAVAGVIFLTVRADAFWIDGNNQLIRALPDKYPHVRVIDWEQQSRQVELCPDGAHLLCGGPGPATFYAQLIFNEIGVAAAP